MRTLQHPFHIRGNVAEVLVACRRHSLCSDRSTEAYFIVSTKGFKRDKHCSACPIQAAFDSSKKHNIFSGNICSLGFALAKTGEAANVGSDPIHNFSLDCGGSSLELGFKKRQKR